MKINQLHIRNIASIERADIDFDHDKGLIDPDTGKPAQKFLIYGDTGTGKSVLLDAIAMALFKNTPRINDVTAKQKNSFTSANGNEVNIFSIEQYTRLGISEKDECYSEVVFTGNDDVEYHAKLELGYTKGRDGKLKNKLSWKVKIGNADWEKMDPKGATITDAIGINFDQFNRMAMLAQGKFETFLCGSKEERSIILEKLTNTSIFTEYGNAIKSVTTNKNRITAAAEERLKMAKRYVDKSEDSDIVKSKLEADTILENRAKREIENIVNILDIAKVIKESQQAADDDRKHLSELQRITLDEEYKRLKALCDNWDKTDKERKALDSKQQRKRELNKANEDEKNLESNFWVMASDLKEYKKKAEDKREAIKTEQNWIDTNSKNDTLYREHKLRSEQITQLEKNIATSETTSKELGEAESMCKNLEDIRVEALNKFQKSKEQNKEAQIVIEELQKKRNSLNPEKLEEESKRLNKLISALELLKKDVATKSDKEQKLKKAEEQRDSLKSELTNAKEEQKSAKDDHDQKLEILNNAKERLATISTSLDETLDNLRAKMAKEHTEVCPLCGQKIGENLLSRDDFAQIITPYEKEQEEAKQKHQESLDKLNKINDKVSTINAKIDEKVSFINTLLPEVEKLRENVAERLKKAGIDDCQDIDKAFDTKIEETAKALENIEDQKKQVAKIQTDIDKKLAEKNSHDQIKDTDEKRYLAAKQAEESNNGKISNLKEQQERQEKDRGELISLLNKTLLAWNDRWKDNLAHSKEQLNKEAEQYLERKERQEKEIQNLGTINSTISNIDLIRDKILETHPEWIELIRKHDQLDGDTTAETANLKKQSEGSHKEGEISTSEWNELLSKCSALARAKEICVNEIAQSNEIIAEWVEETGNDEDYLTSIAARRDDIAAIRKRITDTEAEITKWKQKQQEHNQSIADSTKKLDDMGNISFELAADELQPQSFTFQIENIDTQTEMLVCRQKRLKELEQAAHDRITEYNKILQIDKENKEEQEKAQRDYDEAKKISDHWEILNKRFGGERFRNLVQTYIMRPLLNNANIYLSQISDRYKLTCSEENEQLSILVLDRYNRDEVRSATVLSGGEKFMISLSLSLALSSLNRPDMNVNILFIDEGFGTLDQDNLDSVMNTLERLGEMSGQNGRRVGIISHREELLGRIPNKIKLLHRGEGRSQVEVVYEL